MVSPSQGLYKTVAYKKQTGLGAAASGSGGTLLRRNTMTFSKQKDTYDADEIVAHQQDTGIAYGVSKTSAALDSVLSAGSDAPLLASLCRAAFVNGTQSTGLSLTIAGTGPTFTLTRGSGSYLTDGFKIGDVVRLSAGAFTGTAAGINLMVTALTATVMTVIVPNGSTLTAQGPVTGSTVTATGKKAVIASTGQANDYYTFEEWYADNSKSRVWTDMQPASADVSIPATNFASLKMAFLGLGRTKGTSQVLTTPSAASTTAVLASGNSVIQVGGSQTVVGTSLSLKIDGQIAEGEPVIGSKLITDLVKGDLKVSGTITLLFQDEVTSNFFDNETAIQITAVVFADNTNSSDFVSFNIPAAKLTKDDVDDGKKQLVGTYDFVAQYNPSGGSGTSSDTAIISLQDSAA